MKKFLLLVACYILLTPVALAEKLPNPLAKGGQSFVEPDEIVGRLIKMILGFTGIIAIAVFMYGAVTISTSAGNSAKVDKGKNIIFWAVIGIIVTFAAYAIVNATLKVITF